MHACRGKLDYGGPFNFAIRLRIFESADIYGNCAVSSILMHQRMRMPCPHTSTVLDVVHQVVLSPLNADDYAETGRHRSIIDLGAMQALVDVNAEYEQNAL